jgi:periplasmic copper chaperone A
MNLLRNILVIFTLAFVLVACGFSGFEGLKVTDVWARPGIADGNSAIFFVIENHGDADVLLAASSDVADAVELHKTTMQDGVMRMEHQMKVPVLAGKTEFKPGGLHIMLIGLQDDLQVGDTFIVRLNFELAGDQDYSVTVKEP